MPFWDGDGWLPIQDYYSGEAKRGLKRCIEALTATTFEELRHARSSLVAGVDEPPHVR